MAILIVCLWITISFASWSQEFSEDGKYNGKTYSITKIEVFNLDGTSDFENPGMSDFSSGLWTVTMPNVDYTLATNTSGESSFDWLLSFTGTSSDSLHLAYLVYTSTGQVFGTYLDYNYSVGASKWKTTTIKNLDVDDPIYNRSASTVPLPPAVYLFSGGLLGLAFLRKKIRG